MNATRELVRQSEAKPKQAPQSEAIIGTLRSEDGDGRENVAEKVKLGSFNLHRDYSRSLTLSNVGEPSKS